VLLVPKDFLLEITERMQSILVKETAIFCCLIPKLKRKNGPTQYLLVETKWFRKIDLQIQSLPNC